MSDSSLSLRCPRFDTPVPTQAAPRAADGRAGRRPAEVALAVLLGVAALPVVVVASLLIRATSRGPVFYTQVRVGLGGRLFRIVKLRTMTHNCEAASGATWSAGRADPRVTAVGRVLRRLHLDELPQLWNVIRGDMALVGPRPERPEILAVLEADIPRVRDRLAVPPGVTGLAQIQQPADLTLDCVRRKLVYDRLYAERRSVWLDLRIVFGTVVYLAGASYDRVRKVAGLPAPALAVTDVSAELTLLADDTAEVPALPARPLTRAG